MTFPDLQAGAALQVAFGADLTADHGTWVWTDVSAYWLRSTVDVTSGQQDEQTSAEPAELTFLLDNQDGRFTPEDGRSPYHPHVVTGTPIRLVLLGDALFVGQVGSWEVAWPWGDLSGDDPDVQPGESVVTVQAGGILRRLGQGGPVLHSPLRRAITTTGSGDSDVLVPPVAYWPMEDAEGARAAASALPGGTSMRIAFEADEVLFAFLDLIPGSAPLPDFSPNSRLVGSVPAFISGGWLVGFAVVATAGGGTTYVLRLPMSGGPWAALVATLVAGTGGGDGLSLVGEDEGGAGTALASISEDVAGAGPVWVEVTGQSVGTDVVYSVSMGPTFTGSTPAAGAAGRPTTASLAVTSASVDATAGHLGVWPSPATVRGAVGPALDGHLGEFARDRVERLGAEERIPVVIVGDTIVVDDGFDRTEASGWGTTPQGQDWDTSTAGTTYAVTPGAATMTVASTVGTAEVAVALLDDLPTAPDGEILVQLSRNDDAQTAGVVRWTDSSNYILFGLTPAVTGTNVAIEIRSGAALVGGIGVNRDGGWPDNTPIWLRCRIQSTDVRLRAWVDGDSEPVEWTAIAGILEPALVTGLGNRVGALVQAAQPATSATLTVNQLAFTELVRSERMGVQPLATLKDLLEEAAQTDVAILSETGNDLGFTFRPRASLYNQDPAWTLDGQAGNVGDITNPFLPVLDDLALRNDITVTRAGGLAAHVLDSASIRARGQYEGPVTVSLASDQQLPNQAIWRLHLGTWPGMRYPTLAPALSARVGLIEDWLTLRLGDRIDVTNLPPQHPADTVSLLVQGWTATVRPNMLEVQVNCTPYGRWQVAERAADPPAPGPADPQRRGTNASATVGSFAAGTDTALEVLTTQGPIWATAGASNLHLPLDVRVAGARLRVTDIGPAVEDTFTRTVADGWGTPDVGPAWQLSGVAADFDVAAGEGTISESTGSEGRWATLDVDYADVELLAAVTFEQNVLGDAGLVARTTSDPDQDSYEFTLFAPAATDELHIGRNVGGVFTTLTSVAFPTVAGTKYWVRARCVGDLLQCKAWADGSPEPAVWMLSTTDTSHASGRVGVEHFGGTGALTVSFDDFQVANPQVMTVNQAAVNGIAKAVPVGSDVRLWQPAVRAL